MECGVGPRRECFRGMVSMGSDHGLIDHLALVCDRQTVLHGQLTELLMGEAHDYRMRMIIKQPGPVSTEIIPERPYSGISFSGFLRPYGPGAAAVPIRDRQTSAAKISGAYSAGFNRAFRLSNRTAH